MGWRQNMGAELKKEPFETYAQKPQKEQKAEKELKKDTFAPFALIAPKVQKVKTPEIIIKKTSNCLHGSGCRFISLLDDRQICGRNNEPIFDMAVCPDGRWWTFKLMDKANTVQPTRCYCCGGQSYWRKKDNQGGRYICEVCHPPVLNKNEIEYLR